MTASPVIVCALPTPFDARGEVDRDSFARIIELVAPHADAVFVGGTAGEFPSLDPPEHTRLVEEAVSRLGPHRVIAHIGAPTTRQALRLGSAAAGAGATRFAALTPYYLPAPLSATLDHYDTLRSELAGELFASVFPDVAGTDIRPRDVATLIDVGVAGLKISGTASTRVANYIRRLPADFPVLTGNDADLPRVVAAGGAGTVSGTSAAFPATFAALRDALAGPDRVRVDEAQLAASLCAHIAGPSIRRIKDVIAMRGIGRPYCRMAIGDVEPPVARRLRELTELYG